MAVRWRQGCACAAIAVALLAAPPAGAEARAKRTVGGELTRLLRAGAIDGATRTTSRSAYKTARATARRLTGARRLELLGAVRAVEGIAARGRSRRRGWAR